MYCVTLNKTRQVLSVVNPFIISCVVLPAFRKRTFVLDSKSNMEHLESLQKLCLSGCLLKVTSSLSISNVWSIRRYLMFPWYTNNKSIKFVIDTFICDHFIEISQTDQIFSLEEEEMNWLFDNQDIKACEATMLHCLLRWYKHQEPQRENVLKNLFSKIHLSMIPREYLWSVIKYYDLLKVMPELIEYKVSKLEGFMKRLNMSDSLYQQNLSNIALIGWSSTDTGCIINCYMPLAPKPSVTKFFVQGVPIVSVPKAVVQFLEKILIFLLSKPTVITYYVNGRFDNRLQQNSIKMCLELNKKGFPQFLQCPDYVNPCALTISCGMYVFFLGGDKFSTPLDELNEVYRYDTVNDEWKQMASMIHVHSTSYKQSIAIAYNNRYIFVFGPKHCEKYDIYSNKWSAIQSTPVEISILDTGHTMKDKFCIFGKRRVWEMNVRCFIYDPLADTWQEQIESLPFFCVTNSFFGKNFFLHRKYEFEGCSRMPHPSESNIFTFSELDLENRKKKKLICLSRRKLDWSEKPVFMILLSRRARLYMEQNQTLEYTVDIGQ